VTPEEWVTLPIREQDEAVHTVRGQIRVPTVMVSVNRNPHGVAEWKLFVKE